MAYKTTKSLQFPDVSFVYDDANRLITIKTETETETKKEQIWDNGKAYRYQLEHWLKVKLKPYLSAKGIQNEALWKKVLDENVWADIEEDLNAPMTCSAIKEPKLICDPEDIAFLFSEQVSIADENFLVAKYLADYGKDYLLYKKSQSAPCADWDTNPLTMQEAKEQGFSYNKKMQAVVLTSPEYETCNIPTTIDHQLVKTIIVRSKLHPHIQTMIVPPSIEVNATTFKPLTYLENIVLSEGISQIGIYCFAGCERLQSITIPNSVSSIGTLAFQDCVSLVSIKLPPRSELPEGLFYGCSSLCDVSLPQGITKIPLNCFSGCMGLERLDIPDSVCSFGDYAFSGTGFTSFRIPKNVTDISGKAFMDCKVLEQFYSDSPVFRVEDDRYLIRNADDTLVAIAPYGMQDYVIPDGIKKVDSSYKFSANSYMMKTVVIPKSMQELPLFTYCAGLKKIIILAEVNAIPIDIFNCCTGLQEVILPKTIKTIGHSAFNNCNSLKTIDLSNIETIEFCAFTGSGLTSVVLSDSLTVLGSFAFYGCKNLETACGGKSLGIIQESAFSGCSKLKAVQLPDSLKEIGNEAFKSCVNLDLLLPLSLTHCHLTAFQDVKHLEYHGKLKSKAFLRASSFN